MHGKVQPVLVLEIDTRSDEDVENDRLRDIARNSEQVMGGYDKGEVVDMGTMLKEYSGPMIERDSDMVLYDHMEDCPGSSLFDKSSAGRYASAMGASDEELEMIRKMVESESADGSMPASLSRFKQDYSELKKYGNDPVAMELARQDEQKELELSGSSMDSMLSLSMDQTGMMDMSDPMNEAMAAMEEQFGREAMAVLEGEADGYVVFSVDSPDMGQVKYIYDSKDGVGRVLRG
tara:strand:+ start:315 stop:1016 length:702 start_codon:yes stop_codon:yes gene_type:complete